MSNRLFRYADIIAHKYKIVLAEDAGKAAQIERDIRRGIHGLGTKLYGNVHRGILKQLVGLNPKPEPNDTDYDKLAYKGWKFCKEIVAMLDYLIANVDKVEMVEVRKILKDISDLIQKNGKVEGGTWKFPSVHALIFLGSASSHRRYREGRDKSYGPINSFFSELNGIINGGGSNRSHGLLNKMLELEQIAPEKFPASPETDVDISDLPRRFEPGRSMLTSNEIMDFLRRHGSEYGLGDLDLNLWGRIVVEDPELFNQMTTIINAIRRGHSPRLAPQIIPKLKDMEEEFKGRTEKPNEGLLVNPNAPLTETSAPPASTNIFDPFHTGYPAK